MGSGLRAVGEQRDCRELRGLQEVELGSRGGELGGVWGARKSGELRELEAGGSLGAEGH